MEWFQRFKKAIAIATFPIAVLSANFQKVKAEEAPQFHAPEDAVSQEVSLENEQHLPENNQIIMRALKDKFEWDKQELRLRDLCSKKGYSLETEEVLLEMFRQIDKNYDKINTGTLSKKEYIETVFSALEGVKEFNIINREFITKSRGAIVQELNNYNAAGLNFGDKITAVTIPGTDIRGTAVHEVNHSRGGFKLSSQSPLLETLSARMEEAYCQEQTLLTGDKNKQYSQDNTYSDGSAISFLDNTEVYIPFHSTYKKLELLVGKDFMESWYTKSDGKVDYISKLQETIDSKYGKGVFGEFFPRYLEIYAGLDSVANFTPQDGKVRQEVENGTNQIRTALGDINSGKVNESVKAVKNECADINKILNDSELLSKDCDDTRNGLVRELASDKNELEILRSQRKRNEKIKTLEQQKTEITSMLNKSQSAEEKGQLNSDLENVNFQIINYSDEKTIKQQIEGYEQRCTELEAKIPGYGIEQHKAYLNENLEVSKKVIENYEKMLTPEYKTALQRDMAYSEQTLEWLKNDGDVFKKSIELERVIKGCMQKELENASTPKELLALTDKTANYYKNYITQQRSRDPDTGEFGVNTDPNCPVKEFGEEVIKPLVEKLSKTNCLSQLSSNPEMDAALKRAMLENSHFANIEDVDTKLEDLSIKPIKLNGDDRVIMMTYDKDKLIVAGMLKQSEQGYKYKTISSGADISEEEILITSFEIDKEKAEEILQVKPVKLVNTRQKMQTERRVHVASKDEALAR